MSKFRTPYLSIFLATLILFVSCNPDQILADEETEAMTIDQYTENHVQLVTVLTEMLEKESSINLKALESAGEIDSFQSLESILHDANVLYAEGSVEVLQNVYKKNNHFLSTNKNPNLTAVDDMIRIKLERPSRYSAGFSFFQRGEGVGVTCVSQYNDAKEGCAIAAGISVAVATGIGLATLGIGAVIGLSSAMIGMLICFGRAQRQNDCCTRGCAGVDSEA